jgi:hypothetical protein
VCHLEGNYASQGRSSLHGNGYVDLRNPDGVGEAQITYVSSGASFSFVAFSTSYAAGSRTSTGHLADTIDNVVTQKFCLACHDNNGATNTTARSGAGTATMPFGGVNLGANYSVLNGAAAAGGLIDVKTQLSASNSSKHPVMGPLTKDYPTPARLLAPYNNFTRPGTVGSKTAGVVINCFDCHNSSVSLLTNRTVASHGSNTADRMRGTFYVATPTLCTACHGGTAQYTATSQHGAGSALTTGSSNMSATTFATCNNCHLSNTALPARPVPGFDIHGFNGLLSTGGAWTYGNGNGMRPIAFIRNTVRFTTVSPRPAAAPGITTRTYGDCGGSQPTSCGNNMSRYLPGGSY